MSGLPALSDQCKTRRATFEGRPCKRCGSTTRFVAPIRQCVACHRQWQKDHPRRNRAEKSRAGQRYHSPLGIDAAKYSAILTDQKGGCAICQRPPGRKRLAVDHCHKTGAFRGLLCESCNRGLGMFGDDPIRLQQAIEYLTNNHWAEI